MTPPKRSTPAPGVRIATANPAPDVEIDPEHTPIFSMPPEKPSSLTEYRLKQLEVGFAEHKATMGEAFKEVNTSITDLSTQVAGLAGAVEATAGTVSQAMEIVTASAKGQIHVNTVREVTIIEETADGKKTRRAFTLKLAAIGGTIATAIATAIAAGRC